MRGPVNWLLLDAGNSALKWMVVAAGPAGAAPAARDHGHVAADAGGIAALAALLAGAPPVDAAFGCSVADPGLAQALAQALSAVPPIRWLAAQQRFEHGGLHLASGYAEPGQLGADRWHALLAACDLHRGEPLLVVSAGTATTVDAVRADGQHLGGVIAPGVGLMLASLAGGTARLPRVSWPGEGAEHWPDHTAQAIAAGVLDAQLGLIAQRARRFVSAGTVHPRLLLTGGQAEALAAPLAGALAGLRLELSIEHNLVLRGLYRRAQALADGPHGAR